MTGLMAEHSITLAFEENMVPGESAGDVFINADRGRIAQAVTNLISNAVKFSSQKTSVKIGILTGAFGPVDQKILEMIQSSGDCIMIYVKDQGLGLERGQQEKIFERFYQVENANTRSHSGIGMGLSITKNIVELHDGAIWAESEGKGKGTTFKILLPKGT
jgi:signal transduction histidine kinase